MFAFYAAIVLSYACFVFRRWEDIIYTVFKTKQITVFETCRHTARYEMNRDDVLSVLLLNVFLL